MSAAGNWNLAVEVPWPTPHVIKPTLTLRIAGSVLTGRMSVDGYPPVPIHDGKLNGARVSWKVDINDETMEFTGAINGRRMSGTVSTPWGTFNFTGKQTARIRGFFGLAGSKDASPPSPLT